MQNLGKYWRSKRIYTRFWFWNTLQKSNWNWRI